MAAKLSSPGESQSVSPAQGQRPGLPFMVWGVGILVLGLSLFGSHDMPSDDSLPPRIAAAPAPSASSESSDSVSPELSESKESSKSSKSSESSDRPAGKHLPRARPIRLLIPKISVDAPFTALSIGKSGRLNPPPAGDVNLVGWYARGASPGETGTSIIAGHVDTTTSPAVFVELGDLKRGDKFSVERADGRTASFVVDSVEKFAKNNFPDQRVYADTPDAEARLITCAGAYDHAAKDYTKNLVVFAHLV